MLTGTPQFVGDDGPLLDRPLDYL
ncbi:hypothetical protein XFF6994_5160013 [Xanthomonas citri pv. fuscans]|nr:hypothetical protein XFF6994_5160013 [Xanthomonas citri pv. fuscans]